MVKIKKTGTHTQRIDFSKCESDFEMPNLLDIQLKSYDNFLKNGIKEVLNELFPLNDIKYIDYYFTEDNNSIDDCKNKEIDYTYTLYINVCDSDNNITPVFFGDIPRMTDSGTFIINGGERVVISQIIRAPGLYHTQEVDIKTNNKKYITDLIPARGSWLQLINKDFVSIDRKKKFSPAILLRALGFIKNEKIKEITKLLDIPISNDLIESYFGVKYDNNISQLDALKFIYLNQNGKIQYYTEDSAYNILNLKIFDKTKNEYTETGRYKLNYRFKKLNNNLIYPLNSKWYYETITKEPVIITEKEIGRIDKDNHIITFDDLNTKKHLKENIITKTIYTKDKDIIDILQKIFMVYSIDDEKIIIIGSLINDKYCSSLSLTQSDLFSYFLIGFNNDEEIDDIDTLNNRKVRAVGELLQNQFRLACLKIKKIALERIDNDIKNPLALFNTQIITNTLKDFFSSSGLSQFMDQENPLAELTNKRRISALGQGGITREQASFDIRDVHNSHYGRICPIETPEGQNIGLISYFTSYAKINKYGFIETPYRVVKNGIPTKEIKYLTFDDEKEEIIAQANEIINNEIINNNVIARKNGETIIADKMDVTYADISPKQVISIASACIPFLENDDCTRALMGANMQRQAVPLLCPKAPYVGTGIEGKIAKDCGLSLVCKNSGIVKYVDANKIIINSDIYNLKKYKESNAGTCINQTPCVKIGEYIEEGTVIADGPSMQDGELALGQNVTIAFMTWHGYNYEDAIIISEKLVQDDVYTSLHLEDYSIECRETKLGDEIITKDIPNISNNDYNNLDENGIIKIGTYVKEGDILVGKKSPKSINNILPEERILSTVDKNYNLYYKDNSLRVPHGGEGIVHDIKIFSRKNGDYLQPGVNSMIKIYIIQKRKIGEGDKMAGRHGNKGVISKVLPIEDMPILPDGTPIDIMLNPCGVPSRMNLGQVLEIHLGMAAKKLGVKFSTPVFDGANSEELIDFMNKANMSKDGKISLRDGQTGEYYDNNITVGVMYMIKLAHMVDDKLHARATGPYSAVTQQPLGGKAQNGGQRFGEMEVWALEGYGAANILEEMLTIKSDDIIGRNKAYEAIIKGKEINETESPQSFNVLLNELKGLCLDIELENK